MFNVIEKFISIDGEGPSAGQLAAFIRFSRCNIRCSWCDTKYSWDGSCTTESMTADEIYGYIKDSGVANVTLTGGEPLIQDGIGDLIELLSRDPFLTIRIETNGAVDIAPYKARFKTDNVQFILDYKLPDSRMEHTMIHENFDLLNSWDVYKFVIASERDLLRAIELVREKDLLNKCLVFFSPVVEMYEPVHIVNKMMEEKLNGVRFQLQLHKYVWDKNKRGV
ncbi:MAG: putative 7-carboxy-7-deazaguanine synthase QueE [Turicibacter sp.]|nr:putative 7-carboxy-7-deazaguanine synthase QueE [Turicibacter sp.]